MNRRTLKFLSVFFYFYTFLTFFWSLFCLSVCLVLWASLPEIKIDDDDDDDDADWDGLLCAQGTM